MIGVAQNLPLFCAEHPRARIRHIWDQSHFVLNGIPVGTGIKSNDRYECAECGREVMSDDDAKQFSASNGPEEPSTQLAGPVWEAHRSDGTVIVIDEEEMINSIIKNGLQDCVTKIIRAESARVEESMRARSWVAEPDKAGWWVWWENALAQPEIYCVRIETGLVTGAFYYERKRQRWEGCGLKNSRAIRVVGGWSGPIELPI